MTNPQIKTQIEELSDRVATLEGQLALLEIYVKRLEGVTGQLNPIATPVYGQMFVGDNRLSGF